MKTRSLSLCLLLLHSFSSGGVELVVWDFEDGSLAGWCDGEGALSIDSTQAHGGAASALVTVEPGQGRAPFFGAGLPALDDVHARLLRIRFWVRLEGAKPGDMHVRVLNIMAEGTEPRWFDPLSPDFNEIPAVETWTEVVCEGIVGPEVRAHNVYFSVSGRDSGAKMWVDDIRVELLDGGLLFVGERPGHIFAAEQAELQVIVTAPRDVVSGVVRFRDEEQRTLQELPIEPGKPRIEVALPERGFYDLEAEVAYNDGVHCVVRTPAAVVGPPIPDDLRRKSPFGLTGNGELALMAGANWNRPFVNLNTPEFKQAEETGFIDAGEVKKAPSEFTGIFCLWPEPTWLREIPEGAQDVSDIDMYPIVDRERFKKLVQYAVLSQPNPVEYVEVSNEPDCVWKGPIEKLVQYHIDMADAVHEVLPGAKVIGPGPCTIKTDYLDAMNELGLFDHLDGVVVHAYVHATPPEDEFIRLVRELKAYLASIGRGTMPIYITEYGWTVPPGDWQQPVDPLTQARYVSRSQILLAAEEIDAFLYFNLWWADPHGAGGYGLLNWEKTPRPSYAAYATATRCLAGVSGPGHCLRLTPTTHMVTFRKGDGTTVAVWDVEGSREVWLPQPWQSVRAMTGRPGAVSETSTITAGPSPVFVDLPEAAWYDLVIEQSQTLPQGGTLALPWQPVWTPSILHVEGTTMRVATDAPAGPYLVLGKADGMWRGWAIEVVAAPSSE